MQLTAWKHTRRGEFAKKKERERANAWSNKGMSFAKKENERKRRRRKKRTNCFCAIVNASTLCMHVSLLPLLSRRLTIHTPLLLHQVAER